METGASAATILVVDDDRENADIVRQFLDARGYETRVAYNGDEALAIFDEVHPALVLLDVVMPGRSGWEVCRLMKEHPMHGRTARIIMLTALHALGDKQTALQTGADDYATKPLDFADLLTHIERNLALVRSIPAA